MTTKPLPITSGGLAKSPEKDISINQVAPLIVLTLKRITKHHPDGTFGVILAEDETPICCTIERPWLNNAPGISCIPVGEYICKKRPSSNHFPYEKYEVTGVPNKTDILFHKGNTIEDSKGCILVVTGPDPLGVRKLSGKFSADAFSIFMRYLLNHQSFKLVIESV